VGRAVRARCTGLAALALSGLVVVGCAGDRDAVPAPTTAPVAPAAPPPSSNGWSVSFAGLDDASLCARGLVQFCPPPPAEELPTTTSTAVIDPCATDPVCAAFATPEGRVMPGPRPSDVPPVREVPGSYEGWDVSREPVEPVEITPGQPGVVTTTTVS